MGKNLGKYVCEVTHAAADSRRAALARALRYPTAHCQRNKGIATRAALLMAEEQGGTPLPQFYVPRHTGLW